MSLAYINCIVAALCFANCGQTFYKYNEKNIITNSALLVV